MATGIGKVNATLPPVAIVILPSQVPYILSTVTGGLVIDSITATSIGEGELPSILHSSVNTTSSIVIVVLRTSLTSTFVMYILKVL